MDANSDLRCDYPGVGGRRGYSGAKKLSGRERHLLVDVLGLVLRLVVDDHLTALSGTDTPEEGVRWELLEQCRLDPNRPASIGYERKSDRGRQVHRSLYADYLDWVRGCHATEPYKGAIEALYTAPPTNSVVVCLDEMGPLSARSHAGQELVALHPGAGKPAGRGRQEIDYQRRPTDGYVFGAFQPATGEAQTATYTSRSIRNFIDVLDQVDARIPASVERVYAILDNLATHKAADVLLFNLAHPRWEFVFQPIYAAYLNLIEPWWKILKSLALKGRQFLTWEAVEQAVVEACAYWNAHRHPFVWGKRRRHRLPRKYGIAGMPKATGI